MTEQYNGFTCPVEATISLTGGKYKAVILWDVPETGISLYNCKMHIRG